LLAQTVNSRVTPHLQRAFTRSLVVFAIGLSANTPAWGQSRTDVVRLANGDRVTGEIVQLERGRLRLKTDDAGTIDFEWDNIASVESTRQFEIGTSNGRRLLGSLQPAVGRFILIASSEGDVTLPLPEITTIHPIGASFWSKLDGSINMGYNYTRSSGISQLTLNTDATFRRPAFVVHLSTSGTLTEQADNERDDRGYLELGYVRYRGRRWLVGGAASFENNESLGLQLRSQGTGTIGQRLVNTNRAQLEVGGGLGVNNEQGVDAPSTQNLEAVVSFRTSFFTYDGPKTNFGLSFNYYPSLSSWGRQRLQFDCNLTRELWKDFSFSIDVFDSFDSAPPNPDAARNDVGVVTSIGWTY
jgi:Protein of unknown function, DUF481